MKISPKSVYNFKSFLHAWLTKYLVDNFRMILYYVLPSVKPKKLSQSKALLKSNQQLLPLPLIKYLQRREILQWSITISQNFY